MASRQPTHPFPPRNPRLAARLGLLAGAGLLAALAGAPAPAPAAQGGRSQFVLRYEFTNRIKSQLKKLDTLQQQKSWDEWLNTYQALIDDNPDAVIPRDDEFLDGLRYKLHGQLAALPAAVKQRYRQKFDNPARQLYEQALKAGDGGQMRQVYTRYRHSTHAVRALSWIADRALDTGNPDTARVAYRRVVAEGGSTPTMLFKYSLAARAAGETAEGQAVLERIARGTVAASVSAETRKILEQIPKETGAAELKIGGKQLAASAAALQLLQAQKNVPAPEAAWPRFGGPKGDRRMTGRTATAWRKVWEYTYPQQETGIATLRNSVIMLGYQGWSGMKYTFLTYPVVDGERIYIQGARDVAALNLADGKVLWTNDEFGPVADAGGTPPRLGRVSSTFASKSTARSQVAPALDGGLLAARVPATGTPRRDYMMSVIDTRSGRQLWRRTAEGDPEGSFFNMPALRDNTLYTGVASLLAGINEFRAVALEAGTGDVLWSTYLGGGSDPPGGLDGAPPVLRDGVVWLETSLHTLSGLDAITGEIRTVYRYTPKSRSTSSIDSSGVLPNEAISLIPGTGPIVFSPRWAEEVVGIDPTSGRLLWKWFPRRDASVVFAVDAQNAYLFNSTHLSSYDLETGLKRWTQPAPGQSSSNLGYAAMVGDRLCWLVDGQLHWIDPATGQAGETTDLREGLGESTGGISVLFVGSRLIVCGREKAIAFEPAG